MTYIDSALLQFAGDIGFLSAGLEKTFTRYAIGGMYGFVPAEFSEGPGIETVTLRQTYKFYETERIDFYGGLNIFHVLGLRYQTSKYGDVPASYYSIGGIHGLLNLGTSLTLGKKAKTTFYFEIGMNDIWIQNYLSNTSEISPDDHLTMGMGYKFNF